MSVRAYVPSTLALLQDVVVSGGIGPPPMRAHGVTEALRAAYPDGDEEAWEYAAMSTAAEDSLGLLTDEDRPRRVVIAVDAESATPVGQSAPTLLELPDVVPARNIAAIHVDSEEAEPVVVAALEAWVEAENGDPAATAVVERCADHELGWFAPQEIQELLEL